VLACSVPDADSERLLDSTLRRAGALLSSDAPGTWLALIPPDRDVGELCAAVPGATFGLGPRAMTLEAVGAAVAQARRALEVGRKLEPEGRQHDEAAVGVFAAIADDPEALQHFVDRVLWTVLAQKEPRRQELLNTLEAVVNTNSIGDAAAALGVHRHTIVYRLSRLRELNLDVDSPATRHAIWLALRCLRLVAVS